ncbi:MAG: hypothetical protein ACJA0E_002003 [Bermanella sp.]|jgi:hypothetical protein
MPSWVIVIFVVLMVIGSVAWVRPSPRDKRLADFRYKAIVAGIKVSLTKMAAEPKDSGIRDDVEGASYILYEATPKKGDEKRWAVVKVDGWIKDGLPDNWCWYKQQDIKLTEDISSLIESCPIPVVAIERTPVLSRIVWEEKADDFDANALKAFLVKVQAAV